MKRPCLWSALAAAALLLLPGALAAQRVEVVVGTDGRRVPDAVVQRGRLAPEWMAQAGWVGRVERQVATAQPVAGDMPLIAVLALFADSEEPVLGAEDLQRVLFDGPATDGTLKEFYGENSGGRLNLVGSVTPWVRTSLMREYVVGSEWGLGEDAHVGEYLVEALSLIDPDIDFGEYDNDGPDNVPNSGDDNGIVDAIAFHFLEGNGSCGGEGIWPHFWGLAPSTGSAYETNDLRPDGTPVKIDPYFIQSIAGCGGSSVAAITAIAHELGHLLGLPDLYHPVDGLLASQRRWVVGCWSLMAAGAWGCPSDNSTGMWTRPTHIDAWGKKRLGWLDDIEVVPAAEFETYLLPPVRSSGRILEVPLSDVERLLIEYRERAGFDYYLPAAGVLVYRVNDTLPSRPCAECPPVYRVQLLEADGDSALVETAPQGGNRGVAGDAYGASGPGALTNLTEPSTRHDAGLGPESDVNIYSITLEGSGAR
ncbi:MAG TPA: M6 family metalloprotease domain-containing protein, partial [Gemmatimonadota bacterium]|nr:M6 family metalloprotease domain-containing protein [Gemmatimonadota bacterium]